MGLLCAKGVIQIKSVHAELIGVDDHGIIRNLPGHPVMAANGFQPPYFILIVERDAVGFICAILFKERGKPANTFACTVNVGQDQHDKILFADSTGDFLLVSFCFLQRDQRVGCKDTGI